MKSIVGWAASAICIVAALIVIAPANALDENAAKGECKAQDEALIKMFKKREHLHGYRATVFSPSEKKIYIDSMLCDNAESVAANKKILGLTWDPDKDNYILSGSTKIPYVKLEGTPNWRVVWAFEDELSDKLPILSSPIEKQELLDYVQPFAQQLESSPKADILELKSIHIRDVKLQMLPNGKQFPLARAEVVLGTTRFPAVLALIPEQAGNLVTIIAISEIVGASDLPELNNKEEGDLLIRVLELIIKGNLGERLKSVQSK